MNFDLQMEAAPAEVATVSLAPPPRRRRKTEGVRFTHSLAKFGLLALLSVGSYFICSHFLVQSVQVSGVSMMPTLRDGDQYMLNRWAYFFRPPQRGDVVVLRDPEDNGFDVKRIIAISGESILFKNGEVYVNNQKLAEPYLSAGTTTPSLSNSEDKLIIFGNDHYFVLGDNRWNSADSRLFGAVPRKKIMGKIPR